MIRNTRRNNIVIVDRLLGFCTHTVREIQIDNCIEMIYFLYQLELKLTNFLI